MPRLSSFFGLVVYMYYDDHAPPHFHVLYEGEEGVFGLDGTLRAGRIPRRAVRLIEEWAEAHHVELEENCGQSSNCPFKPSRHCAEEVR